MCFHFGFGFYHSIAFKGCSKTCDTSNWVVIVGFSHRLNSQVTAALGYHHCSALSWLCDITMSPIIWILKSSHLPKNLIPFIYLKTSWYTEYTFNGSDPKTGGSSTFAEYDMQKISCIFHIYVGLNRFSINRKLGDIWFSEMYHHLPVPSIIID
jgi:hypothetical protein